MSADVLHTPELDSKVREEPHRMTDNSGCQRELEALKEEIRQLRAGSQFSQVPTLTRMLEHAANTIDKLKVELAGYERLHKRTFYPQENPRG